MHVAFERVRRKISPARIVTYVLLEDEHSAGGGEIACGEGIKI